MNIKKASPNLALCWPHPGQFAPVADRLFRLLIVLSLFAGPVLAAWPGKKSRNQEKTRTAEEIVERALLSYGGRPAIYVIQRNGIYRSNLKLFTASGVQEGRTITRFIRKPKLGEDLVTIELELPDLKYTITTDGKEVWATQNGLPQKPSDQEIRGFRSSHEHHYEALLRYKENESKLE